MATGRINSPESIRTAAEVVHAFGGSWQAVEDASSLRADGVRIISRKKIEDARRRMQSPR